jgi:phosphate starvation-inducible protein PhoH
LQFDGFEGQMCNAVRDAIIQRLGEHKQLPVGFKHPADFDCPMNLTRLARNVIGRAQEQEAMMTALRTGGAVIVWGAAGEGKSALAIDTAYKMWEAGEVKGGALRVDLTGKPNRLARCSLQGLQPIGVH